MDMATGHTFRGFQVARFGIDATTVAGGIGIDDG